MNNIDADRNSIFSDKEVIFFDDFSSEQLDRSKWNVEITGKTVNDEQQAYIDSSETIYIEQGYPLSSTQGTSKVIQRKREDPLILYLVESTRVIKWNSHLAVFLRASFSPQVQVYGPLFGH
jgi:type I restriction-modification system DNA methylase subunit